MMSLQEDLYFVAELDTDTEVMWFSKLFILYATENNDESHESSRSQYYSGLVTQLKQQLQRIYGKEFLHQLEKDTLPEIDFFSQVARTVVSKIIFDNMGTQEKSKANMKTFLRLYGRFLKHCLELKGYKCFTSTIHDIIIFIDWE